MPIKIPDSLPARATLEGENIFVMTEYRALHQDIRPLKVLILNLMPTKIVTETQILRKLSNTPLQVQVELLRTSSYRSQHIDEDHLESFYTTFDQVRGRKYDGMIITGAPVENLDFTQVEYWDELCEIMEWTRSHVHSTLHICWGAQAGLYFHYGVEKRSLPEKLFGVFDHRVLKPNSPLFRGFDDVFQAPHSRYTEVWESDIRSTPGLELLAVSGDAGVFVTRNTTPTPWPGSTSGTGKKGCRSMCPIITFPATIPAAPPSSAGGAPGSFSIPTGSITTSIRPRLTI